MRCGASQGGGSRSVEVTWTASGSGDLTREELEELTWQLGRGRTIPGREGEAELDEQFASAIERSDPYRRRDERQKDRNGQAQQQSRHGRQREQRLAASSEATNTEATSKTPRRGRPANGRGCRLLAVPADGGEGCEVDHDAMVCAACDATLGAAQRCRQDSAHYVYDLERTAMALQINAAKHRYFVGRCTCGHETISRSRNRTPLEKIEGRRRNLQLTERCLVGPMLASFIADAVNTRFRLSRQKIQEFLTRSIGLAWSWEPPASTAAFASSAWPASRWSRIWIEEIRAAEVVHLERDAMVPARHVVVAVGRNHRHGGSLPASAVAPGKS